ncbi:hypothetical protein SLS55_005677 [Diplodia seriata]|uniref:Sister chromatid cohesion acetyltransferase Eco1 n=1 Tax=Diplodia seriata TaxID=420778 RepID=A0A1S8BEN8_9PEZI|nr:hypothetical protein BK809_0002151 [Diplodia seriata]
MASPSAIQVTAPSDDKTSSKEKLPQQRQPRLTQLQLDLGVAPVQRMCKTCGMAYVPSNAEDAALHKRFHAMNVGGVDVGKGFFARSAEKGRGAGEIVWEKGVDGDFVVVVGRREKVAARTRVRRVLDVVERELGAVEIPDHELWGQVAVEENAGNKHTRKGEHVRNNISAGIDTEIESKPQKGAGTNGTNGTGRNRTRGVDVMRADRFKAYLYIRGSKCVGLCLAERITEAYRVVDVPENGSSQAQTTTVASTKTSEDQTGSTDATEPSTGASSDCPSTTITTTPTTPRTLTFSSITHPADLGISRIWVSSLHRRHGIAIALLDAAARDFCAYRCEENDGGGGEERKGPLKERIAFSQPTDSGSRLARRWFGAETGWGVYT